MGQQTAVEWLVDQLYKKQKYYSGETVLLFQQAKQMEKEQIVDALQTGWVMGCSKEAPKVLHTKQYYNEKYGKENT